MKYTTLPIEQLEAWSKLNDVNLFGTAISPNILTEAGTSKGAGLRSTGQHLSNDVLLSVPADLILSKDRVEQCSKTDKNLRDVLEAVGSFGQNSRKAILIFLIVQMTHSSPEFVPNAIGVGGPFSDYVEFLPKHIPLPTFYTSQERDLLDGTSLEEALNQKLNSLDREFEHFRTSTESIKWCQDVWWDEETGKLSIDDWKLADAMYRSRALDLPKGVGDAMVPVLDVANHASGKELNARFDIDDQGQVLLVVRDDMQVRHDEEVTIKYGERGACEMIFSYGFVEADTSSARELLLGLSIPSDDPLRMAKIHYAKQAPGVRVYIDASGELKWEGDIVWWACVNEEDGLDFELLQSTDGNTELQVTWKGETLQPSELKLKLFSDSMSDVYQLRATVMVLERIEEQGMRLQASQAQFDEYNPSGAKQDSVWSTIRKLRELEMELLETSYRSLEEEKTRLLASPTVSEYLQGMTTQTATTTTTTTTMDYVEDEDFS